MPEMLRSPVFILHTYERVSSNPGEGEKKRNLDSNHDYDVHLT